MLSLQPIHSNPSDGFRILAINPILPLGQHLELMLQQFVSVCLASALTLLELYCVIKARNATTPTSPAPPPPPPGAAMPSVPYNSSAAAVAGVWLVLLVFGVGFVRSAKPALMMPCINFTVVAVVTSSVAPTLPNMSAATDFASRMLTVNVIGLALSFAVGVFVLPSTNRKAFQKDACDLAERIEQCLAVRLAILKDDADWIEAQGAMGPPSNEQYLSRCRTTHQSIASSTSAMLSVLSKMQLDLSYIGKEWAVSHVSNEDLEQVHLLLLDIVKSLVGLMSSMDGVSRLPINADLDWHQRSLSAVTFKSTQTHQIIIDALHTALQCLNWQKSASVKISKEAKTPAVSPVSSLKQETHDLHSMSKADLEDWQSSIESSTERQDEVQRTLFGITLQVRLACASCRDTVLTQRRLSNSLLQLALLP